MNDVAALLTILITFAGVAFLIVVLLFATVLAGVLADRLTGTPVDDKEDEES